MDTTLENCKIVNIFSGNNQTIEKQIFNTSEQGDVQNKDEYAFLKQEIETLKLELSSSRSSFNRINREYEWAVGQVKLKDELIKTLINKYGLNE